MRAEGIELNPAPDVTTCARNEVRTGSDVRLYEGLSLKPPVLARCGSKAAINRCHRIGDNGESLTCFPSAKTLRELSDRRGRCWDGGRQRALLHWAVRLCYWSPEKNNKGGEVINEGQSMMSSHDHVTKVTALWRQVPHVSKRL
ncbi:hypothetical protein EVAR_26726_1 [Eumeta japonica]|uniref:Uncharacterized protein n=1 Tax=Eumeta variegata TaxID=151549 RepID=A0A4C1XCY9_EUMVA|nr:hypothetical protein EVAR_26726_1 [Eumeta japonica]